MNKITSNIEIVIFIYNRGIRKKRSLKDVILNKIILIKPRFLCFGRGRRTRTLTRGFGDRHATIDTIPLNINTFNILAQKKEIRNDF